MHCKYKFCNIYIDVKYNVYRSVDITFVLNHVTTSVDITNDIKPSISITLTTLAPISIPEFLVVICSSAYVPPKLFPTPLPH